MSDNKEATEAKYFITITRQSEGNPPTDHHVLSERTEVSYPIEICKDFVSRRTETTPHAKPQTVYLTEDQGTFWNGVRSLWRPYELWFGTSPHVITNSYVINTIKAPKQSEPQNPYLQWCRPKLWMISHGLGSYNFHPNPLKKLCKCG